MKTGDTKLPKTVCWLQMVCVPSGRIFRLMKFSVCRIMGYAILYISSEPQSSCSLKLKTASVNSEVHTEGKGQEDDVFRAGWYHESGKFQDNG